MEIELFGDENKSKLDDLIAKELLENRIISLNQSISSYTIDEIVDLIRYINIQDDKNNVGLSSRKPIQLHVSSYGGSVYDGWSIVSEIISSRTPVHTYTNAYAMSMGLAIFMAGHKRFVSKFATLMYHELSSSLEGSREEIRRATEEYDRLQEMYDDFIVERSNLTLDELKAHQKNVNDWYISSEVAVEKGLATDLI